jgi:TRAP-type mannitol/chloroaromatic compound transport system permease large subunit
MNPVWLGVMMAINLQTSFLTPPFGFALFYLRGVAPDSVRTIDIYRGVFPFVMIQILALVIIWYLPKVVTWLPSLIYGQ